MKKLMIAATIVCVAVLSQAAQVKWTTATIYTPNADGSFSSDTAKDKKMSVTAAIAFYLAGTDTEVAGITGGTSSSAFSKTGGLYSTTESAGIDLGPFVQNQSYDYVITYTGTYDGKEWTMEGKGTFTNDKGTGNYNLAANTGSAWTAVPEPTSSLLLLIGVAGLALRRRRA